MRNTLFTFVLLAVSAVTALAGDNANVSYEQLLREITTPPASASVPEAKAAFVQQAEGRYWVTIKTSDKRERTALLEAGLDIVEVERDRVSGIAGPELEGLLASKSVTVLGKTPLAAYFTSFAKDFPSQDEIYHNYQETTDRLRSLAAANSDIASLFSIGKTVEGRDLWCLRVNSNAKGETPSSKPGAFFLGNIHAREHLANEVPLLFAAWLLEHRSDAEIKKYISSLDIYVLPMGNPDGAEYDIKNGDYQYYRKNMAKNANGSRGVDLNRNFDSWWCESGASTYPGADTYCGPKAFSEPESQHIKRFMESRRNIRTHISYHTYGSLILYPWGGNEADVPDERDRNVFIKAGDAMAKLTGYYSQKSSDMYVATGDSADWAYAATGAFAFTFELEGRGFYPGAAIIKNSVEKNIKAGLYLLGITDNPYKVL
ncbi:MAG: M14 family metallopeptidase [Elusimicrobiales bacterium]